MGRGSAVIARWNVNPGSAVGDSPPARFVMREAILGGGGEDATLPVASCFTPDWADDGDTSKHVMAYEDRGAQNEYASTQLLDPTGTNTDYAEFCFTPSGRAFVRHATGDAFVALTGVYRFAVQNTATNYTRFVILPPSGAARLVTKL
jgi:hypothetical protein